MCWNLRAEKLSWKVWVVSVESVRIKSIKKQGTVIAAEEYHKEEEEKLAFQGRMASGEGGVGNKRNLGNGLENIALNSCV